MTRPVCLVTGATGAIGPAVIQALRPTYAIRTFSRRPPPAGLFVEPVEAYTGDIADPRAVGRATEGADAVVHLAALLHIVDPRPEKRAEYARVNVQGTAAVVDAALSHHLARVVLMSTIAVYGDSAGAVLTEESTPHPDTLYGETKLAAERIALAAHRADGVPLVTVLRAGAVYGPRVKGNYQRLVQAIASRRFIPIGPGSNRRTLVFDEDLASGVALAVGHPAAAGRIYNVSDGEFHTMHEIVAAIAAGLGRQPPAWHLPVTAARVAIRAASLFDRRLMGMLDTYLEDVAVTAERIRVELGLRPRFDLSHGWAQTIERMRQESAFKL
jgi:UDP-glucose 4-epimerase